MPLISTITRRIPLWVLIVGALSTGIAPTAAHAEDPQTRMTVVNIDKVLSEMNERKEVQEKFKTEQEKSDQEAHSKEAEVQQLQAKCAQFKDGTEELRKAQQELLEANLKYRVWAELMTAEFARKHKQQMMDLFKKIQIAVAEVAQKHGADVVLADRPTDLPDSEKMNADEVRGFIASRNVLFRAAKVDITDEVINTLNARFAKPAK